MKVFKGRILYSVVRNVRSKLRNVCSKLRNVRSELWNVKIVGTNTLYEGYKLSNTLLRKKISLAFLCLIKLNSATKSHFVSQIKHNLTKKSYLCAVCITSEALMGRGWTDIHIGKGVFVRFGFDVWESRKFKLLVKSKAMQNAS